MRKPTQPTRQNAFRPSGSLKRKSLQGLVLLATAGLLAGCNMTIMFPSGDVAVQQRNLIVASVALMLLVVLPVIALTFIFAWRYRASNTDAPYDPEFHHSTQLEVVIWTVPLLIIIALGAMTWIGTHTLDPFRPLARIAPGKPVPADMKPLKVEVVALDWKWLFIYPEFGIASVNEIAAPANVPISFRITSSSVFNTFYVPALAGMIYAMPGMESPLQAIMNHEGEFTGLSAQYSGTGFSRMTFSFQSLGEQGFNEWIAKARSAGAPLDRETYLNLEKPSEKEPVRYFSSVENGLFDAVVGMCVQPGQMCVHEMHHIDSMGGAAEGSEENRKRLDYDNRHRLESGNEPSAATFPASGRPPQGSVQPQGMMPRDQNMTRGGVNAPQTHPDQGQGNALPGANREPAPAQLNNQPADGHQH
ncbi:ubiquinol oxidase subunit II [Microvirga lotononidis]|uniref:Ubiquinol oxidase polypeptide II n=1 Tax=Microvirga lotononidis TaxID=864069 RepID=I4YV89_9HYPH|nr:ubiquinol oxidase subunit II [Microvirga lotononidis]EIM27881.1 cytochrome o ubiquinol oxidase subunit II [Microvirga lotononidis]WQO27991.1 ubiquinol oxidase subunit II [Microvirga lotononidis]